MSSTGSKRGSISTIRSKSTRRSSSNLALIQEQSTSPTGSPILNRETPQVGPTAVDGSPVQSQDHYDDTTPLNPNHNLDGEVKTMPSLLPTRSVEEEKKGKRRKKSAAEGGWVHYARLILPHVGMVMLCVLYALTGATVFYLVERPQELRIRNHNLFTLRRTRDNILRDLYALTQDPLITRHQFREAAFHKSDAFIKLLFESFDEGQYMSPAAFNQLISVSTIMNEYPYPQGMMKGGAEGRLEEIEAMMQKNETVIPDMWSFINSLLFATATLTTVGYGQIAPVTTEGRLLCVGFGLLGIPLTLMTIADIGKFFGEGLKRLYSLWGNCREGFSACVRRCLGKSPTYELQAQDEEAQTGSTADAKSETKESKKMEKSPEEKSKEKDEDEKEENALEKTKAEAKAAEELAANVSTTIPVEWIFVCILAYTFMGAGLFKFTEPWTLLESFYFCFITMTTIGYGDFVPLNQNYFALTLLYIVLGLAITTMSIDQAGSEYIKKIHNFGRKIKRAKQAFSNVRNMISYANWVKRRYGLTDQQMKAMSHLPGFFAFDVTTGAYVPYCYKRLCFIDQRTESMLEEIFTISTTESDHESSGLVEIATNETDFGSRRCTTGGSLAGHSISWQYREAGGAWTRVRKILMEQRVEREREVRRSASMDVTCFSFQRTPTQLLPPGLSHLERIAALQRIRRTASANGYGMGRPPRPTSFNRPLTGNDTRVSKFGTNNNNDHSPKMETVANKSVTVIDMKELDKSLITL